MFGSWDFAIGFFSLRNATRAKRARYSGQHGSKPAALTYQIINTSPKEEKAAIPAL
jgi:hypothetical protein